MSNEEIMQAVKPAVCAQLKSPASAQFPVDLISIVGDESRGYHIEGYVDSQNSYGAMIRNDFTAEVAIENGFPVVKGQQGPGKGIWHKLSRYHHFYLRYGRPFVLHHLSNGGTVNRYKEVLLWHLSGWRGLPGAFPRALSTAM